VCAAPTAGDHAGCHDPAPRISAPVAAISGDAQELRETIVLGNAFTGPAFAEKAYMNANDARAMLLAQHTRIRVQLDVCIGLARMYSADPTVGSQLDSELWQLRDELDQHNQLETTIIGELLHGSAAWGGLLIDRMLEEHIAEHATFWGYLKGTRAEVADRISDLAEELDAHMAAEERTFLSPVTLRDDVIQAQLRVE
jgi:iron-sulfur cluster repair protein YtfE (RIC family)